MGDRRYGLRNPPPDFMRKIQLHQQWLRTRGDFGVRIGGDEVPLDCSGFILDGVDLSLGILNSANFRGASLQEAWFIGADLLSADFRDCELRYARFENADLRWATFIGSNYGAAYLDFARTGETIWTQEDRAVISRGFEEKHKATQHLLKARKNWTAADYRAHEISLDANEADLERQHAVATRKSMRIWRQRKQLFTANL